MLDKFMIELITGIVGFAAGIGIAALFFRKKQRQNLETGYVKVRQDMFPKKNDFSSKPLYPILGESGQTSNQQLGTSSQESTGNQEDPKLPNWFG
jgi:hypothetical protein